MIGTHARAGLVVLGALALCLAPPLGPTAFVAGVSPALAQPAGPPGDVPGATESGESGQALPGQPAPKGAASTGLDERLRKAEQLADTDLAGGKKAPSVAAQPAPPPTPQKINLLELLLRGRWLMLPIAAMSLLVVAIGAERFLGLRRSRVVPTRLVDGLDELAAHPEGFDPRRAYRLCRSHRSTAATVVQAMLVKLGRPHSELERTIAEANQREAERLYSNVRWLNLAAAVTPLLGLFGTVWGMIQAFFQTANLPVEANRAQILADGIWTALVTTFAGLAVAIPAAVLAHYFEGRIQKLFREIDERLVGILPQLERFEGRVRFTKADFERSEGPSAGGSLTGAAGSAKEEPRRRRPAAPTK
jgi:biopolymer transport protein ExbB